MDWILPFRPLTAGPLVDPGLPRMLLRHLLLGRDVLLGSRVLDVGCGAGNLVRFLDQLGIDATGLDESPDCIRAAREAAPHLPFVLGSAHQPLPFPERSFNLIIVRDAALFGSDLLSEAALCGTARLLAALCPGGQLLLVAPQGNSPDNLICGHPRSCFVRHLASFGTAVEVATVTASRLSEFARRWIHPGRVARGHLVAAIRVLGPGRTFENWQQLVSEVRAPGSKGACCPAKQRPEGETVKIRKAA